jgi:hypothetical protein
VINRGDEALWLWRGEVTKAAAVGLSFSSSSSSSVFLHTRLALTKKKETCLLWLLL